MKSLLKTFPVIVKIPVIWGDMDSFQHVNNVVYFRYFRALASSILRLWAGVYKGEKGHVPDFKFHFLSISDSPLLSRYSIYGCKNNRIVLETF